MSETPPVYRPTTPRLLADSSARGTIDRRQIDPAFVWDPADPKLRFQVATVVTFFAAAVHAWCIGSIGFVFVGAAASVCVGIVSMFIPWHSLALIAVGVGGCIAGAEAEPATATKLLGLFVCPALVLVPIAKVIALSR